jgi:aminoglycoside phosphotransferase
VQALSKSAKGTVIHGDLCFSNILYDVSSAVCRLIDPRGSFGTVGIGGDPRYDIAKLWHSVAGGYDFLATDFFDVRWNDNEVTLDVPWRAQHRRLRGLFKERFSDDYDFSEISLITGLMMCSLPDLHRESARRQVALYASGLRLVHEALDS